MQFTRQIFISASVALLTTTVFMSSGLLGPVGCSHSKITEKVLKNIHFIPWTFMDVGYPGASYKGPVSPGLRTSVFVFSYKCPPGAPDYGGLKPFQIPV
jgi:hypothetical protein